MVIFSWSDLKAQLEENTDFIVINLKAFGERVFHNLSIGYVLVVRNDWYDLNPPLTSQIDKFNIKVLIIKYLCSMT